MKTPSLAECRVVIEIALWRHGWAWPTAVLLVALAMLGNLWLLQPGRQMHRVAEFELAQERSRLAAQAQGEKANDPMDTRQRLQALQVVLRPAVEPTALVRKLAALAQAEQIILAQSEYQQQIDAGTGLTRIQISQPVRASYPQLRRYIEAVLQAVPNASLDQVVARRDNVGQTQVEARLKWSLWMDRTPQPVPDAPLGKEGRP